MGEPVTFQFEGYLSRIEIHSFLSDEQVKDAERRYGGKVALSHYTVPDLDTLRAAGYVPASDPDALRAEVETLRKVLERVDRFFADGGYLPDTEPRATVLRALHREA